MREYNQPIFRQNLVNMSRGLWHFSEKLKLTRQEVFLILAGPPQATKID
jgi:hypothetical protein